MLLMPFRESLKRSFAESVIQFVGHSAQLFSPHSDHMDTGS